MFIFRRMVPCLVIVWPVVLNTPARGTEPDASITIRHSRTIELADSPNAVAVSGDGSTILVAFGRGVAAIDATTGKEVNRWEQTERIVDTCLSASGRRIAVTTGSPLIDVYDRESGERLSRLHRRDAADFLRRDGQHGIAFYPDGTKVISSGTRSRIYVSDVETGDWDHIVWTKYKTSTPVASPDGKYVVLVGMQNDVELSGQLTMYRIRRGLQPLWTRWHESKDAVTHAAFSQDGLRLASAGAGDGARVWKVKTGEPLGHIKGGSRHRLLNVSFVADGNHLLTASAREILLWRLDRESIEASMPFSEQESLLGAACSHDGEVVATFNSAAAVNLWSVARP